MGGQILVKPAGQGERPVLFSAGEQVAARGVAAEGKSVVALDPDDVAQVARLPQPPPPQPARPRPPAHTLSLGEEARRLRQPFLLSRFRKPAQNFFRLLV